MGNRIIINPETDYIEETIDDNGTGHLFHQGIGIECNLEMSDYCVNKGDIVPYHIHEYGHELFLVSKGSVDMVVGGRKTKAIEGDMILIPPFTPHAFEYSENGTVWYEIIHGMNLWDNCKSMEQIIINCPEKFEDHPFMKEFFAHEGRVDYLGYPFLELEEVKSSDLPGFSGKGMYYKKYNLPGIECRIKFPRWQLGNFKEIWEYVLDKGFSVTWGKPYFSHEFMIVSEGSAEVEVQGYGVMTANKGSIISIPNYTEHKITALERGTVIQDFNVQFDMFLMMDELKTFRQIEPDRMNEAFIREAFMKYKCPFTSISGLINS